MSDGTFNGSLQFAALRAEAEGFLHMASAFRALMSVEGKPSALQPTGEEESLAQAEFLQTKRGELG